jgi:hypothetical protein
LPRKARKSAAAFQRHIKFSFFMGGSLKPVPPIGQYRDVRSLDVREPDRLDEKQLAVRRPARF